MRREVFLSDDLRATLAALLYAHAATAPTAYEDGYRDALTAVAIATGLIDTSARRPVISRNPAGVAALIERGSVTHA